MNNKSIISVQKFQHFLHNDDGLMNFTSGFERVDSQYLLVYYYFINGAILAAKEKVLKWTCHFGSKEFKMEVAPNEAIDIDTYYDYVIAKAYYQAIAPTLKARVALSFGISAFCLSRNEVLVCA